MKLVTATLTAILALMALVAPVGAQVPTDYDEMGRPIRNNQEILVTLEDVPQGSLCQISDINNISTYPPNETLNDRGNVLLVMRGRGGEHNGDWLSAPAERRVGIEMFPDFVTTGDGFGGPGNVVVWVRFDRHHSIDDVTVNCTPELPPTPTTTTTTAPETTTTTVVQTTTSSVAEGPTTTTTEGPPELAVTGPGRTGALLIVAGVLFVFGMLALLAVSDEQTDG